MSGWTVAPWFHCDMAERHGTNPIGRAVLRGGVAFCPYCGGTRATHREAHMMDGRVAWIDDPARR